MSSSDCVSGNEEAFLEIQNFLKALGSYPERFARNPEVSFEQHYRTLMAVKRHGFGPVRRNGSDGRKS